MLGGSRDSSRGLCLVPRAGAHRCFAGARRQGLPHRARRAGVRQRPRRADRSADHHLFPRLLRRPGARWRSRPRLHRGLIQIAIDPLEGRCVAGARGRIRVEGATVIARAPSRRSRPGQNTVRLPLATPLQALGSIVQRFRLAHGVTSTEVRRSPRGDWLYWRWRGRSRAPILLVVGRRFRPSDHRRPVRFQRGGRLRQVDSLLGRRGTP